MVETLSNQFRGHLHRSACRVPGSHQRMWGAVPQPWQAAQRCALGVRRTPSMEGSRPSKPSPSSRKAISRVTGTVYQPHLSHSEKLQGRWWQAGVGDWQSVTGQQAHAGLGVRALQHVSHGKVQAAAAGLAHARGCQRRHGKDGAEPQGAALTA